MDNRYLESALNINWTEWTDAVSILKNRLTTDHVCGLPTSNTFISYANELFEHSDPSSNNSNDTSNATVFGRQPWHKIAITKGSFYMPTDATTSTLRCLASHP